MWKFYWWFAVFVGTIPIIGRIISCILNKGLCLDLEYVFNSVDVSLMGLAINWTNVTESHHLVLNNKKRKKFSDLVVGALWLVTKGLILCLGGLIFVLYTFELTTGNEHIVDNARWIALFLTGVSLLISYCYIKKINEK